jgi:hypothetical protein
MNIREMRKKRKSRGEDYISTKGYLMSGKNDEINPCSQVKLGC